MNLLFLCATITVDNTPPTIICPQNIVEQLNCGIQSTLIQLEATAQDNCGPAGITYSSSGATSFSQQSQNIATMNVGTSTVIATATDTSQRTANCQFTVTIRQGKISNFRNGLIACLERSRYVTNFLLLIRPTFNSVFLMLKIRKKCYQHDPP